MCTDWLSKTIAELCVYYVKPAGLQHVMRYQVHILGAPCASRTQQIGEWETGGTRREGQCPPPPPSTKDVNLSQMIYSTKLKLCLLICRQFSLNKFLTYVNIFFLSFLSQLFLLFLVLLFSLFLVLLFLLFLVFF